MNKKQTIKVDFQKEENSGETIFLRMVRSGSRETHRPQAGGEGIGCPARMSGGILPAPPQRHTSRCASEGGIPAAQPRGCSEGWSQPRWRRSADLQSALDSRPCGASPQHRTPKADSSSALRPPFFGNARSASARSGRNPAGSAGLLHPALPAHGTISRCCRGAAGWFGDVSSAHSAVPPG